MPIRFPSFLPTKAACKGHAKLWQKDEALGTPEQTAKPDPLKQGCSASGPCLTFLKTITPHPAMGKQPFLATKASPPSARF